MINNEITEIMNTEEKARAYDEALKKAQRIKNGEGDWSYSDLIEIGPALTEIFPELKESEEDEDKLNCCISSIEEAKENRYAYKETDGDTSYDREIDWLKSLRPSWKPSDEQMNGLAHAINLDVYDAKRYKLDSLYNDLKKLM